MYVPESLELEYQDGTVEDCPPVKASERANSSVEELVEASFVW